MKMKIMYEQKHKKTKRKINDFLKSLTIESEKVYKRQFFQRCPRLKNVAKANVESGANSLGLVGPYSVTDLCQIM